MRTQHTESEFLNLADTTLSRLEERIEAAANEADVDIEIERSGNVLMLEFENGEKIIINSQVAMKEIWVAAKAGGFHFAFHDDRWLDTRDGAELFAALSELMSAQSGGSAVTITG